MKALRTMTLMMLTSILWSCKSSHPPLETVEYVDLDRYVGTWYDVASFPQRFQKGCHCTSATYAQEDGYVSVINACNKDSIDGVRSVANGKAFITDEETNAKLKVQFFWPFKGKYWIIGLDDNYQYAVIGEPSRRYLWILSRTPMLSAELYNEAVKIARSKGFPVENLERVEHNGCL